MTFLSTTAVKNLIIQLLEAYANTTDNTIDDKAVEIIKPILMTFLSTCAVKNLIIQLLEAYAKSTDNTIDDKAVEIVRRNLFPGIKDE